MLVLLIFYAFAFYFAFWSIYILVKSRLSPLAKIPGYSLYNPVLGNLWSLSQKSIFERWEMNYKKFGTIYRWYTVMGHTYITITSPNYLKQILVSDSKKYARGAPVGIEIFRKIVGEHSMLVTDGEEHRQHRSIVSPAFRIGNLRKLIQVMHGCSTRLCTHLDGLLAESGGAVLTSVDIRRHLSHTTLAVIGLAGFGFDFDCIGKRNRLAEVLVTLNGSQRQYGILQMLPYSYYYPFPITRHFWSCLWTVRAIIDGLVQSKRELKERSAECTEKDLLAMILENTDKEVIRDKNRNIFSERELRDEVMTFIMAGHETSSLALTWSIAMLCEHQDWQDACRREVLSVLDNDREVTWDHLDRLKVTTAVVQETMRLWPPIPAVARDAVVDDQIGPYKIPAGTSVIGLIGQMHRLPDYWPKPNEFLPERFLSGDVPWDAYLPFGDGPHKCLGYQFAMAEIVVVLAALLSKYRFQMASDWKKLKVQGFVTLQPASPILVDIKLL